MLLAEAETWNGRLFALAFLALFLAIGFLCGWLWGRRRRSGRIAAAAGCVALGGLLICDVESPSGIAAPGAKLQSIFPPGDRYCRWSPVNLVPEIDQAKLGAIISPMADQIMTRQKANRLKGLFIATYREMDRDPEFVAVGSVMNTSYRDTFRLPFDQRHLYVYIPAHPANQRLPAIVFLHGSAGGFKVYMWIWKRFADAHGVAIVAPTFGAGNWYEPGGLEAIEAAYDYCKGLQAVDSNQIYLAGLSNGAIGVSREVSAHPERYHGIIYISGVMEPDVMAGPGFVNGCIEKPILVLHGEQDERIPPPFIRDTIALLPGSMHIETHFIPDQDHFLILDAFDTVDQTVSHWMQSVR